jgi:replicative DNA helicase
MEMMDSSSVERAVLGGLLLIPAVWNQASVLREENFSLPAHQLIFRRMRALAELGLSIDMITLSEELRRHRELLNRKQRDSHDVVSQGA